MYKTHLIAYLAIPMPSQEPFEKETQKTRKVLYAMLDELCGLSEQVEFDFEHFGVFKPTISLLEDRESNKRIIRLFGDQAILECEFLKTTITVPFSIDEVPINAKLEPSTDTRQRSICEFLIRESFMKQISNMLIAANLAHVGSIELKNSIIIQDDVQQEYAQIPPMDSWSLQRSVELSEKIGWPKLQIIDFLKIWKWLNRHEDFFKKGFSNSPMGRALSAFSHIFEYSTRDEPMQLLWALIGVESLYVKGQMALLEQVREKTQILLGSQEGYKKKIVRMYDFRSRFVHGDLNFPSSYPLIDDYEIFGEDLLESISLAVAILVATIQEIIQRDWSGLEFTYSAINPINPTK